MNKKIEINLLFFFLIEALFILFFFKESFYNIILGSFLGIILIILSNKIKKNKITQYCLKISSIILASTILYKTIFFISDNILQNYSPIIIGVAFILVTFNLLKRDYHPFIKSVEISSYIYFFLKIITLLLIIPLIKINNLDFSLITDFKIDEGVFYIAFSLLILYRYIYYVLDYHVSKKVIIISITNFIIIYLLSFINLGKTLFNIYKYPYINYLKQIKYFNFIERMEGILSFQYLFSFFFLCCFLLLNLKLKQKKINKN